MKGSKNQLIKFPISQLVTLTFSYYNYSYKSEKCQAPKQIDVTVLTAIGLG